jgi:hypothetical protein
VVWLAFDFIIILMDKSKLKLIKSRTRSIGQESTQPKEVVNDTVAASTAMAIAPYERTRSHEDSKNPSTDTLELRRMKDDLRESNVKINSSSRSSMQMHKSSSETLDAAHAPTKKKPEPAHVEKLHVKSAPLIAEDQVDSIPREYEGAATISNVPVRPRPGDSSAAPRWTVKWTCGDCGNTCIPVRSESRCLCGHRYKEHKASVGDSADRIRFSCASKNCACKHFFFVVAEGAWILRCRCKHKHIEHECGTKPFLCKKNKCPCVGFDRYAAMRDNSDGLTFLAGWCMCSPWVCNCGHPWASHNQSVEQVVASSVFSRMMGGMVADEVAVMMTAMDTNAIADLNMDHRVDGEL